MPTRMAILALAGLTGCTMYYPTHRAPPRPVVIVEPSPRLMVIVGSDIRYCAECDEDVFFYLDTWYVYRYGGWYHCTTWGAPWVIVPRGRLPAPFIRVPPGQFRHRYGKTHPAHDHHPELDTWKDDDGRGAEVGNERGKDGDKGRGRGRGNKRGRGPY